MPTPSIQPRIGFVGVLLALKESITMVDNVQTFEQGYAGLATAAERNKVLRNTYWLLSLSMVPTVLGAWIGVQTGIASAMTPAKARRCSQLGLRLGPIA